ncbi:uncharacterized protein LOC142941599 [Anarhichas minor]|uniref:uncharacterized protein LOC142941599 n=1 Tax=Anarhichas minor TaxID=65739 RepID=UPI003F735008
MSEFRWIKTSLSLILVLQFTAAATRQLLLFVNVRDGDEVTLPCNSVIDGHESCDSTTWIFTNLRISSTVVELVRDGQIVKDKSDRLSVSEKCSLVIKNVTDEDGARYDCRQFRSGQLLGENAVVHLSVVTMTEHEEDNKVTLRCSVSTYEYEHRVKWLLQGQDVDEDHRDFKTSQSYCSASLTFPTSHFIYTLRFNSFKCKVTRGDKVQQFSFRNSPSGEKTGDDTITATTESTPTEDVTKAANTTTPSAISSIWWYVIVAVVLVALLIITVALIKWKRAKGNTTRTDCNVGLTSHPAPETSQDTADPEEGVSYASVSYIKKTNSKAQGRSKHDDDDDDDAVTYATVKASSADPSILYAAIT